jgi:hypothetical protein
MWRLMLEEVLIFLVVLVLAGTAFAIGAWVLAPIILIAYVVWMVRTVLPPPKPR